MSTTTVALKDQAEKNKYVNRLKGTPKVTQLNGIANQLLIHYSNATVFQSYNSIIAIQYKDNGKVILGKDYNYSKTTSKYLNLFLGLSSSIEVKKNIESGLYTIDETLV